MLRDRLGLRLKVLAEIAIQWNETCREVYKTALSLLVISLADVLVFVHETANGRNAAHRNRAWSKRGEKKKSERCLMLILDTATALFLMLVSVSQELQA